MQGYLLAFFWGREGGLARGCLMAGRHYGVVVLRGFMVLRLSFLAQALHSSSLMALELIFTA